MLSNIDHYGKPRLPKGDEFSEKFQKVFVYVYWRGGPGGSFKIHRLFLVQRLEVIFSISATYSYTYIQYHLNKLSSVYLDHTLDI